jgi:hypothetical protein
MLNAGNIVDEVGGLNVRDVTSDVCGNVYRSVICVDVNASSYARGRYDPISFTAVWTALLKIHINTFGLIETPKSVTHFTTFPRHSRYTVR